MAVSLKKMLHRFYARGDRCRRGQALIEMIFILPLIMVLIVWLMQGVEVVRASVEQQKYLKLNLFMRLANQTKYTVDYLGAMANNTPTREVFTGRENSMFVVYQNQAYSTKNLAGSLAEFQARGGARVVIQSRLGICLRPDCDR